MIIKAYFQAIKQVETIPRSVLNVSTTKYLHTSSNTFFYEFKKLPSTHFYGYWFKIIVTTKVA